jgi:catalase
MVARLTLIAAELAERVSYGLGLDLASLPEPLHPGPTDDGVPDAAGGLTEAPSLSMVTEDTHPLDGRVVQILADDGADLVGIRTVQAALRDAGVAVHVVATHKGHIHGTRTGDQLLVDKSFHTASGAEADCLVVAGGAGLTDDAGVIAHLQVAYRHHKPIAAWGDGTALLEAAGATEGAPGIVTAERATKTFATAIRDAMAVHRHWDRAPEHPTRTLVNEEA